MRQIQTLVSKSSQSCLEEESVGRQHGSHMTKRNLEEDLIKDESRQPGGARRAP